jgi:hypothetical protein
MRTLSSLLLLSSLVACVDQLDTDELTEAVCYDPDTCYTEPPPAQPPPAPVPIATARTTSSITVQFTTVTVDQTQLYRRAPGGTWTLLRTWAGGGARTLTDTGRGADQMSCYKVRVSNEHGTTDGTEACAVTLPISNIVPVNRLQLRVTVADVTDAGTSNKVSAKLGSTTLPGHNHTGLNYHQNDFGRGSQFTYDLGLENVTELHDITEITLSNFSSSDGMCVAAFTLYVNGGAAYTQSFGNTATTCRWIGGSGHPSSYTVTHAMLRASSGFTAFSSPAVPTEYRWIDGVFHACISIPRDEIESRLEGMVGDKLWGQSDIYWGPVYGRAAVEAAKRDDRTLKIDLDLADNSPYTPDPEVDMDFDIGVALTPVAGGGYNLDLDVRNLHVSVDYPWWFETLGIAFAPICLAATESDCVTAVENVIADAVKKGFTLESRRIPLAAAGACELTPIARVDVDGSLLLACPLSQ